MSLWQNVTDLCFVIAQSVPTCNIFHYQGQTEKLLGSVCSCTYCDKYTGSLNSMFDQKYRKTHIQLYGIHILVLNGSEEYHSTEKRLHGPPVCYNWKPLYRFFTTVLITHMIFLNTEINDGSVLCVKARKCYKKAFLPSPFELPVVNDLAFLVHCSTTTEVCPQTDTCGVMLLACRNVQRPTPSLLLHSGLG